MSLIKYMYSNGAGRKDQRRERKDYEKGRGERKGRKGGRDRGKREYHLGFFTRDSI